MSQSPWRHLSELLTNDSRYWSARFIGTGSSCLGVERDTLVVGISIFVSILLVLDHTSQLVANSLLVIIPIISTFVYPNERPSNATLVIYWSTFGFLTVLDSIMMSVLGWHVIKLGFMCALFIRPPYLAGHLVVMLEQRNPLAKRTLSQIFSAEDMRDLRCQSSESVICSMVGPASCEATQLSDSTSTMGTITSEPATSQATNKVISLPSSGNTPNPGELFVDLDRSRPEAAELIKDRISVDYAILPAHTPMDKFSYELIENAQLRRRKNILVHYNR